MKSDIQTSKTMSYLLRHGALVENIPMASDGYVQVSVLLNHPKLKNVTLQDVQTIVENDRKTRYSMQLTESGWLIRCNQGHSITSVSLDLKVIQPLVCVHATKMECLERICKLHVMCSVGRNLENETKPYSFITSAYNAWPS